MKSELRIPSNTDIYPCLMTRETTGDVFLMTAPNAGMKVHSTNEDFIGDYSDTWNNSDLVKYNNEVILTNS